MLKYKTFLLIFLLMLPLQINCNTFDDYLENGLAYMRPIVRDCSAYFEYVRSDGFIIGKLKLPNIKIGDTVKLYFDTVKFKYAPTFNGIFLPDDSPQEVISKVKNGQPISYRIDLPLCDYLPQLENITINDNPLCTAKVHEYKDEIVLQHTLEITNDSLPVYKNNIYVHRFAEVPTCGLIDPEIKRKGLSPLIYGGTVIERGEHPWLAAIYKKHRTGIAFICGGSLVTSTMVLTAAHCFEGFNVAADKILVYLGRYNLTNYNENDVEICNVERIVIHPEYKSIGLQFPDADLALMILQKPVSFSKYIQPICVWSESSDQSLLINETGVVAGWGNDEDGNSITEAPKKVQLDIVSEVDCLRSSPAFPAITSARTLCAGKRDGFGPCEGDSGGGLMLNRDGIWMLRGIVSAGLTFQQRCNLREFTVYCDVAKHWYWLRNYIGQQEKPIVGTVDDVCGKSGTEPRNEYPWLAAIYRKVFTGELYHCSGALITPRSVLTAAFCLELARTKLKAEYLSVYFGRYDLNNIEEKNVVRREVATTIQHPQFTGKVVGYIYEYDIALLQLKTPVSFTPNIKPICLWSESADVPQAKGQAVTLLNWVRLKVYDETLTMPQSLEVNIASFDQCQSSGFSRDTLTSFLCTPRFEDNIGGILMFKSEERWYLRGIASANAFYTERLSPKPFRVYSDIAQYLSWIRLKMLQ